MWPKHVVYISSGHMDPTHESSVRRSTLRSICAW